MNYTVTWTPEALNELSSLWMQSADRNAIARASNRVDRELKRNPYRLSSPRMPPSHVMAIPPLGVAFDVSEADCLVSVWGVWALPRSDA